MSRKIIIKRIVIIVLIIIIISLISAIVNIKSTNIEKQISTKEQLTELASDGQYVSLATHFEEVNENAAGGEIQYLVVGSGSNNPSVYTDTTVASTITCNIASKLTANGIDMSTITKSDLILRVKSMGQHNCYYAANTTVTLTPSISAFNNTTGVVTISNWCKTLGADGYGRSDRLYVATYEILLPYFV